MIVIVIYLVKLPQLFDIMFKRREREFDKFRWPLLEWAIDLDGNTVTRIQTIENYQRFATAIITLLYLVQVNIR